MDRQRLCPCRHHQPSTINHQLLPLPQEEEAMAERRMEKAFIDEGGAGVGGFGPEPDAADLALINQRFALEALASEAVYVRRMVLANDAVDRSFERFPKGVLER